MDLKKEIQKAAVDKDIDGITAFVEHCDIPYQRLRKTWEGSGKAKFEDVEAAFASLGFELKAVKVTGDTK